MAEADDRQLVKVDQYLLRGRSDSTRKFFRLNGDSIREVRCAAGFCFGDLAIKNGKLLAIVDARCVLVSDIRSGAQLRAINVPFQEELEGLTLFGSSVFVWTSSVIYLLDEVGNDHVKVGEANIIADFECPASDSTENSDVDSQPSGDQTRDGLWKVYVLRYDPACAEFEAIVRYDMRKGEWRMFCEDGSLVRHEKLVDDPWELIGVRRSVTWIHKSQGNQMRVVARRNGDIVHELDCSHMTFLWHGVIAEESLLYLRYCDIDGVDYVDVVDISGNRTKLLRTFTLGNEPGCAWFVPVIRDAPNA